MPPLVVFCSAAMAAVNVMLLVTPSCVIAATAANPADVVAPISALIGAEIVDRFTTLSPLAMPVLICVSAV